MLALVLAFACALPFAELISISMLFYGATTAFEFAALLVLRRSEPDTPRPFRIPVTRQWLPVAAAPPVMLCLLLICLAPREAWVIFILSIAVGLGTFFLAHGCTMKAAEACWKPHLAADAAFDLGDERDASHPQGVVAPTGGSGRAGSGNGSGRVQREGRSSAGRASSASAGVVPRFLFQGSGQSSGGYGKLRTVERRSHEGAAVELFGDESVDDPPSPLVAATAAEVTHPKKGGRRGRAGAGASEEGRGGGGLGGNNAGSGTNGSAELSIAVAEVDAPPSAPGPPSVAPRATGAWDSFARCNARGRAPCSRNHHGRVAVRVHKMRLRLCYMDVACHSWRVTHAVVTHRGSVRRVVRLHGAPRCKRSRSPARGPCI